MSEKKYRLVGAYWVSSENSIYYKIGAGAWTAMPLTFAGSGGWYYVSNDEAADDLIFNLEDAFLTELASIPYAGSLQRNLNTTTGVLSFDWTGADTLLLKFEHPTTPLTNPTSYFFHNALRMTTTQSSTITFASGSPTTVTGTRCHGYGLYPLRYLMSDLSEYQARVSQAVPDQGQVQTLRSAMLELYRLGIRTDIAYPRAALFNEYHALVDFLDNAASGRPFRVYPDKTVYTAYADASNPYGYRTWVLDKDSASWRPEPAVNNFYKVLDVDLKCWQWVE